MMLVAQREALRELGDLLNSKPWFAFDTEFIRESTFFPEFEILQIAIEDQVWLIDVKTVVKQGRVDDLKPIAAAMQNPNILKVLHAAQGDQECLYWLFGKIALPVFDTAVGGALCGHGDSVGLATLTKAVLGRTLKKGHSRTNWSMRPLPPQLIEYAEQDVVWMLELATKLRSKLEESGRWQWALKLSEQAGSSEVYDVAPETIATRLAQSAGFDPLDDAILLELVRWRENRVRRANLPRRWIAEDSVLITLAKAKPKDLKHLESFRGIGNGEIRRGGQAILDAIALGVSHRGDIHLERLPRAASATADEARLVDAMKCIIGLLSDETGVAPKYLVTADRLLGIARAPRDIQVWVKRGLLTEQASGLVGPILLEFLLGKRTLSVRENAVVIA